MFDNKILRCNDINSLYKLPKYSESVLSSLWERSSVNKRINTPLIQDNCDEHILHPQLHLYMMQDINRLCKLQNYDDAALISKI